MHKMTLFTAFLLALTPLSTFADAPHFSDYPVIEIYQETNHPAIKDGDYDDSFLERQAALKTQKVNYAGHYIVYWKDCGENCIAPFITDIKKGKNVGSFDKYYLNDKQNIPFKIEYKLNSSLLIISGTKKYISEYPTQIYWDVNKGRIKGYYDFHKIEHHEADFKKYCQDLNAGKKFNDTSDFTCTYPNTTINAIYKKLLNSSEDHRFMNYPLPKIGKEKGYNFKNDGDSAGIHYKWLSHNSLQVKIYQQSVGKTNYTITQDKHTVTVQIHTEKIRTSK